VRTAWRITVVPVALDAWADESSTLQAGRCRRLPRLLSAVAPASRGPRWIRRLPPAGRLEGDREGRWRPPARASDSVVIRRQELLAGWSRGSGRARIRRCRGGL